MTTTVDTNNWDAVYAIHFSKLNLSIAEHWQAINMQFKETDASGSPLQYVLDATFAPWLLALGGDGKNVRFTCPIQSGSFSLQQLNGTVIKSYSFPTTAPFTEIAIEVGMEWVPDPSQTFFSIADKPTIDSLVTVLDSQTTVPTALAQLFVQNNIILDSSAKVNIVNSGLDWAIVNKGLLPDPIKIHNLIEEIQYFYILYARQLDKNQQVETEFLYVYKFGQKWQANLKLMETDIETGGSAVTVTNILNSPIPATDKVPALLFTELVNDWFNVNLKDFNQIFAQANITTTLDKDSNYNWLTPTATSYA